MNFVRILAGNRRPDAARSMVYHVGPAGRAVLHPRPFEGTGDVFWGSGYIHRLLAPEHVWFYTKAEQVWGDEGRALLDEDAAVYGLAVEDMPSMNARVTNDFFNCWADEENAIYHLLQRFRELDIESLADLLVLDPDFIFQDSCREGILTGRAYRNRERIAAFFRERLAEGLTPEEADDLLDNGADDALWEGFIGREDFSVTQCAIRTRSELELLWRNVREGWLSQNTEVFDPARHDEFVIWNRSVLVPGPLAVIPGT